MMNEMQKIIPEYVEMYGVVCLEIIHPKSTGQLVVTPYMPLIAHISIFNVILWATLLFSTVLMQKWSHTSAFSVKIIDNLLTLDFLDLDGPVEL